MACPGRNHLAEYSVEHIQVLAGLEPIRRRPVMYVGDLGSRGLHHLLFELVANSLAEAVAGHGRSVRVTLRTDGSAEVADEGRTPSAAGVERAFAVIGTGPGKFCPYTEGRDYFACVIANALAERFTVSVRIDRSVYQHSFRRGTTHAVLQSGGPSDDRGLTIRFLPDPQIFGAAQFDADTIRDRLRRSAFAHSGIRITFSEETTGTRDEFEYADGIREYVLSSSTERRPLHADVILIRGEEEGVR
jgi:DNA gyrase subunit B